MPTKRSPKTTLPMILLAGIALAGLLVVGCESDTPTDTSPEAAAQAAEATESPSAEAEDSRHIRVRVPDAEPEDRPMFVVDGVVLSSSLDREAVDALDIASIEVIRGAKAASMYGTRAAGGVVLITTKRESR